MTQTNKEHSTKNTNQYMWHIIKCPAGVEEKFITNLKEGLIKFNIEEDLEDYYIPKYEKRTNNFRSIMAVYIFVKINKSEKFELAMNSIKYASFLLNNDLTFAIVDEETIQNLKNEEKEQNIKKEEKISVGRTVLILEDTLFKNFEGVIEKVDEIKEIASVSVSVLGTNLSVELPFTAIKVINNGEVI